MAYITNAEGDTYFEGHMFADPWTDASEILKTKASEHATRIINRLAYKGLKTVAAQTDEFPRDITNDLIPQDVKDANAEIALALLDGIDPEREVEDLSVTSQGYAQVRSTYDRDFARISTAVGVPSEVAFSLLLKYFVNPGEVKMSRVS